MKNEFTILPMKTKDYGSGKIVCCPIENFPEYRKLWDTPVDRDLFSCLGDNRKFFAKLFGKKSCQWTGEFRFDCWLLDLKTTEVLILTAGTRGTCYEMVIKKNGNKIRKDPTKVLKLMCWIGKQKRKYEKV